jgi:hypothetical protein
MSLALFTIVQDETDALQLWLAHHRVYAPTAELYVLDHESVGDAALTLQDAQADGVTVVPVRHSVSFDYDWLTRVVEDFAGFLLRSYEAVGFAEIDELLWPAPDIAGNTLERVLETIPEPFVRAAGRGVVHHHPEEPPLRLDQPLLAQRRHWYRTERYSKICLFRQRVYWKNGFHAAYNVPASQPATPALINLHLHQADYARALRRHQRNAGRSWDPRFRQSDLGSHQRLENPSELSRYLLANLDRPKEYAALEEIPTVYQESYRVCLPR